MFLVKFNMCKPLILFLFLLICQQSTSEKRLDKTELNNDCSKCKILTDSFTFWFKKTSRGKYDGGDAAWEESKLKSYAQSEIRLAEIQENLCSELPKRRQDLCYALSEEVEQVLENWWTPKNLHTGDLYEWLCIENLKYCCPKSHYGENCNSCPMKNNKVCNGHGSCNGEETRKGNGSCICNIGYSGINCGECDQNYFSVNDVCELCHRACNGCHGISQSACIECADGWVLKVNTCTDVNECNDTSLCKNNAYCLNLEGSYACYLCDANCKTCAGPGPSECTSCEVNSTLIADKCIDDLELKQIWNRILIKAFIFIAIIVVLTSVLYYAAGFFSICVLIVSIFFCYLESINEINILDVIVFKTLISAY